MRTALHFEAFFGWATITTDTKQIVLYEYDNPVSTSKTVIQQGHSKLYLIWWVNGQGWNGQPAVPSSFEEVYQRGKIAIYLREAAS